MLFGDGHRSWPRWRWLAAAGAALVAVAGVGALAYSSSQGPPPRYQATASMVSMFPADAPRVRWMHSAIRDARRIAVARLVLGGEPPRIPSPRGIALVLPRFKPVSVPGIDAGELLRATRVTPSPKGNAIDFTVTSSDAAAAQRLATAWAATHLNWWRLGEIRKQAQLYRDADQVLRTERGLTAQQRAEWANMRNVTGRSLQRPYTLSSYQPAGGAIRIAPT